MGPNMSKTKNAAKPTLATAPERQTITRADVGPVPAEVVSEDNGTLEVTSKTGETLHLKKAKCPLSREQFAQLAKSLLVTFENEEGKRETIAEPKTFSTGSLGWGINNEKLVLMVGGVPVKVQLGVNITIVNSKELPGFTPKVKE